MNLDENSNADSSANSGLGASSSASTGSGASSSAQASAANFILGTAGHIDHGKSTLVRTLTGTDPDRLAEEKRRGITIELGFAQLQLPSGRSCGVVDVPGHERFVKHMVEGATGIDIALLVVAADDGVMVQTREHLAILELLGVRKLVAAITKSDAVEPDLAELAALDLSDLLATTSYKDAAIVPVSAHTGNGIPELLAAIDNAADALNRSTSNAFVRLPIDRVFSIEGAGTVVTGTLWDGIIHTEDQLEIIHNSKEGSNKEPSAVRVRSVQVHGQQCSKARAGQRVALNLAGIKREQISRGEMLVSPKKLRPTSRFIAKLHYTGNPLKSPSATTDANTKDELKDGSTVVVHHGTKETQARVKFLFSKSRINSIPAGDNAYVQLRLDKDLPLHYADRFIIRSLSPAFTIGGGSVLLAESDQRTKLSSAWFDLLDLLSNEENDKAVVSYVELKAMPFNSEEVALKLGVDTATAAAALNQSELARMKVAKDAKGETFYLSEVALAHMRTRVESALLEYHDEQPQALNISQGALRKRALPNSVDNSTRQVPLAPLAAAWTESRFEALLIQMDADKTIVFEAGKVSHPKATSSVQALHKQLAEQLLPAIQAQGLSVSSVAEHAAALDYPREIVAQVLGNMQREGQLIRLASEYHFAPEHVEGAQEVLVAELSTKEAGMTAAEIRDLWQVSRKYAIPLMEYFDARGITRRNGDIRHLSS